MSSQAAIAQELPQDHAERMRRGMILFRSHIRGILRGHCLECHGGKSAEAGFNLSTRAGLLKGSANGAVVKLYQPQASRIMQFVRHQATPHMPAELPKLSDEAIAHLEQWIYFGAPFDRPLQARAVSQQGELIVRDEDRDFWSFRRLKRPPLPLAVNEAAIDRFLIAQLETKRLSFSEPLDRRSFLRRAKLDLHGLPPTPDEIHAYLRDQNPGATLRMIDRLLASPRYGERWARHWLDVARFAESFGFEHDLDNGNAYHYRDFVIRALNRDLAYDQFVKWQIAGDQLAPNEPLARLATAFMAVGVRNADIAKVGVEQERYNELDDMVNTMGTAILGLSLGCARCHDHKFDPIPSRDYYRLASYFTKTIRGEVELNTGLPGGERATVLVAGEGIKPLPRVYNPGPPHYDQVHFLKRGDLRQKSGIARSGLLQLFSQNGDDPAKAPTRKSLANWLVDVERGAGHLAARVIVNRLWQHHFGVGLVATANDFGERGVRPSHPLLLEWLACELVANDWSLKSIHRQIMSSKAYRQSYADSKVAMARDPQNRLLWRYPKRRLEAEAIRDCRVALSDDWDSTMLGPGSLDPSQRRRSIYFTVKRSKLMPMMMAFDAPDPLQSLASRQVTTIAPQALALMNSRYVREHARQFALTIRKEQHKLEQFVNSVFERALVRRPTPTEAAAALRFLKAQAQIYSRSRVEQPFARIRDDSLVVELIAPDSRAASKKWQNQSRFGDRLNAIPQGEVDWIQFADERRFAARFREVNSRLEIEHNKSLDFGTGDFTLSILFRPAMSATTNGHLVGKDSYPGSGNSYTGFFLQYLSSGQLRFATRDLREGNGPVNYLDSSSPLSVGRWHRVTAVRKSGQLALFLEDSPSANQTRVESKPTNVNTTGALRLGEMDSDPSGGFHGEVAALLVYRRALTLKEVQSTHRYFAHEMLGGAGSDPLVLAMTDFCQAVFCLNEFVYYP